MVPEPVKYQLQQELSCLQQPRGVTAASIFYVPTRFPLTRAETAPFYRGRNRGTRVKQPFQMNDKARIQIQVLRLPKDLACQALLPLPQAVSVMITGYL